jgi:hypothetical protein
MRMDGGVTRWGVIAICVGLLLAFAWLSRSAVRTKSSTYDEPIHAVGGWTHLRFGDFRNNFEDPPLWQYWAALPVGSDALKVNWRLPSWTGMNQSSDTEQWIFATQVLYRTPGNDGEAFIQQMRAQMVWVGVALGAVICWWSWRLGGAAAALSATIFYALDPNFLAHSALVKNDVPMAFVMFLFVIAVWKIGQRITYLRLLAISLVTGAALTVKFSGGLLVPIAIVLLVIRSFLPTPWPALRWPLTKVSHKLYASAAILVVMGLVSIVFIWGVYGFRFNAATDLTFRINTPFIKRQAAVSATQQKHPDRHPTTQELEAWKPDPFIKMIDWALDHEVLPEAWLNGLLFVHARSGIRSAYLLGKVSNVGFWYYFPLAMLFKTATATLLAGFVLLGLWTYRKIRAPQETQLVDPWTAFVLVVPLRFI